MNGQISINRCSGEKGYVCALEICDVDSGVLVIRAELSFEAFGHAITGLSGQPMSYKLGERLARVGQKHEHKIEHVRIPEGESILFWQDTESNRFLLDRALKPLEVDGWVAQRDRAFNLRKFRREGEDIVITMGFDRYVSV